MNLLDRINRSVNRFFGAIAGICLVGILTVMVLNMTLRITVSPLQGTYDYVSLLGAISISFGLGYTQLSRDHVSVHLLLDLLPARLAGLIKGLMMAGSAVFFGFLTWWLVDYAHQVYLAEEGTRTLHWPVWPFVYLVTIGTLAMTLALLVDCIRDLRAVIWPESAEDFSLEGEVADVVAPDDESNESHPGEDG